MKEEKELEVADQEALKPFAEDFALLVEMGFVAVYQMDQDSALKAFLAAKLLRPEDPTPNIGLAYVNIYKLDLDNVKSGMQEVLGKDSSQHVALALKGLANVLEQKEKAESGIQELHEAAVKSREPVIDEMYEFMTKWLQKKKEDQEKSLSPLSMMEKEQNSHSSSSSK